MKYALLLYVDAKARQEATEEERREALERHGGFIALLKERDAFLGGEELGGPGEAVTLRKGSGQALRTDGPFVETVEHLGGFYLIEARDLDEAIELARACPVDIVEIRPVVEHQG
ncbi:YciI family protein [Nonomuraea lactucae]|uniref:YciI family protein n=1 Tax=Nonomuraea lactucae TaxID=2249762 RepID=UPI000DE33EDE|nr:YciI family protein [Nonomuraea lactucae]